MPKNGYIAIFTAIKSSLGISNANNNKFSRLKLWVARTFKHLLANLNNSHWMHELFESNPLDCPCPRNGILRLFSLLSIHILLRRTIQCPFFFRRGFSEQSLSLPTSQSGTKVISLVDFGRFLPSSFLHLGVPRKPERFLLLLLFTTAALDPTLFPTEAYRCHSTSDL